MTGFLLIVIAALAATVLVLFLLAKTRGKAIDRAAADLTAYKMALEDARNDAESLQATLRAQARAEEKANAEKQGLSKTADGDLVRRANRLF